MFSGLSFRRKPESRMPCKSIFLDTGLRRCDKEFALG